MKIINLILVVIIPLVYTGCRMGPTTYEVFERLNNARIGGVVFPAMRDKETIYDKEYYIYPIERPKGCIWGYIVKRSDEKKIIVGWRIISGEEFCKEQQAYSLF